jgi:hypothetical protein
VKYQGKIPTKQQTTRNRNINRSCYREGIGGRGRVTKREEEGDMVEVLSMHA